MNVTGSNVAKRKQQAVGYGMAVLVTAFATLLRMALAPLFGAAAPFLIYFVGTLFVVWYFGFGPAVLNIVFSAAAGLLLFASDSSTSPFYSAPGRVGRLSVLGYIATAAAAAFLLDLQRRSLQRINREVGQRKESERELARVQAQLEVELSGMRCLHELATRLMDQSDLRVVLGEIISAAETITHADMGTIQLLDAAGVSRMEAQHGWPDEFLEFFETLRESENSEWASVFSSRQRVIVEDIGQSPIFAGTSAVDAMRAAGACALQSTPLITRAGALIGMLSTYYRQPSRPSERDLRLLDLLARQAADLIERVRAEDALRASEERYRATFDNAALGIAHVALDGRWMRFNDAICAITGYSRQQLETKTFADITHPEDLEKDWALARGVAAGEIPTYSLEKRYIRGDGSTVWVNLTVSLLRDHSGAPVHYVSVIEDITPRKRAEEALRNRGEELRAANAALARSNDDLKRFAFAASHDLQEPLRMITLYSQLLIRSYPGEFDERAGTFVASIVDGTKRMRELLTDLLAYTQLGSNPPEPLEMVDLNAVLADVKANLMASIEESGASITAEELPTLYAHRGHFTSLFQNLIGNAIKYRSEMPLRINVSMKRNGSDWQFAVSDNGIGIDPQYHQHIFEVFKRLHDRSIPGTGIGLPICKRVVERYGGRMWVESCEGQGATFFFSLPAMAVVAAAE